MIKVKMTNSNLVQDITFDKSLDYLSEHQEEFSNYKHETIANAYAEKGYKVGSVLIGKEILSEKLWDDPRHCHHTNNIIISKVQEEARRRFTNNYYNHDELVATMTKYGIHAWETNYKVGEEKKNSDHKFKFQLEDFMFKAQEEMLYPEIVKDLTKHTKYKLDDCGYLLEDEDGGFIAVDEVTAKQQYQDELEKIFMPRVQTVYDRVIHMPKPFDYWDARNNFQQYFLVDKGKALYHTHGGSGSSKQREHQGRYAHVFATLEKDYEYTIPTYTFHYNSNNKMVFLKEYTNFRSINRELSGNYQNTDRETIRKLFKDKLLYIENNSFKELVDYE